MRVFMETQYALPQTRSINSQKNDVTAKFRETFAKISFRFEKYRVNSDFVSISRNIFEFRFVSYRIVSEILYFVSFRFALKKSHTAYP